MTNRLRGTVAAIALIVAAVLSGCSMPTVSYADLDREATPQDALPDLPDYAFENFEVQTARFVGEDDGTRLWLATGGPMTTVCLIIVPSGGDSWLVNCSGSGLESRGPAGDFGVRADGEPLPEGATALSENVHSLP